MERCSRKQGKLNSGAESYIVSAYGIFITGYPCPKVRWETITQYLSSKGKGWNRKAHADTPEMLAFGITHCQLTFVVTIHVGHRNCSYPIFLLSTESENTWQMQMGLNLSVTKRKPQTFGSVQQCRSTWAVTSCQHLGTCKTISPSQRCLLCPKQGWRVQPQQLPSDGIQIIFC